MIFQTVGNIENPAVLFFHAMGVTGKSSSPVAEHLKDRYYCIMPTSTVYCAGQNYISKADELRQLEAYLVEAADHGACVGGVLLGGRPGLCVSCRNEAAGSSCVF